MPNISTKRAAVALVAMLALPVSAGLAAQELDPIDPGASTVAEDAGVVEDHITVLGSLPADLSVLPMGPEVEGFISSRRGRQIEVTSADGSKRTISIADATEIRARGGFLGLNRRQLTAESLLNGLPVTVDTVYWDEGLVASRVSFKRSDLETAEMIRGATAQQFAEQGAAIGENSEAIDANAAATEALRGRVANIDQYNIRGTTNVYFDTGSWDLSPRGEFNLCAAAAEADAMDNALLLVVGYTDSVGNQDYNQVLSERRAGRVVNFLQQECGWAPWRMLTPTGMAESDPQADNSTEEGRAQNRRVSVNILVSKALEED